MCSTSMLQTNNPRKIKVLEELGVVVTARIPCIVEAQEHNIGYLATKQVSVTLRQMHYATKILSGT